MPAYVVVQLASGGGGARRSSGGHGVLSSRDFGRLLSAHDADLIASPAPEAAGAGTAATATIAVPDMTRADALAAALRGMDGIETAYAKPGEELP
jgi:hypothetical protein